MTDYLMISAASIVAWFIVLGCSLGVAYMLKMLIRDAGSIANIHKWKDHFDTCTFRKNHKRMEAK